MDTDLLASLIGRKHDVLEKIRDLARRQMECIQQAEMTALLTLLAAKQTLINELTELERQLDPFREQDPDVRVWRSQADRLRCRQTAERAAALLEEVMLVEKQCESEIRTRRDDVARRLDSMHNATHAQSAYFHAGPHLSAHGQFDLSSER